MGKYGDTAVRALELLRSTNVSAEAAWGEAAEEMFPHSLTGQSKSCPREAFLGLCHEGRVRGVSADRCTRSRDSKNGRYACVAADLLATHPELALGSNVGLWRLVMQAVGEHPSKAHNSQIDVVLALQPELQ